MSTSEEKAQIILDEMRRFLKIQILVNGLSEECKAVLLELYVKMELMER